MKINFIYKKFDEYQSSAYVAKATRQNNLKRVKNENNILIENRI